MRILLADDSREIVRFVERILQDEGHEVLIARDGLEAIQQAAAHHPQAAILDVNMPGMEGWEVCERLKASYSIPVMLLTVQDEKVDIERGRRLGVDDHMSKPFDIHEFVERLRAMLAHAYPA